MKRNNKVLLAGLLSVALFTSVHAQEDSLSTVEEQPWDLRVKLSLDQLAREADRAPYTAGICVWDLTDDTYFWGYNNHKVLRPASTQKVLTAITALNTIGAQHTINTRSYYTGSIAEDGTLQGDIYVVGDFDPMYSHDDLKELARAVRDLGIKRISGKIYGDASMKNSDLYGNGWCWDDALSTLPHTLPTPLVTNSRISASQAPVQKLCPTVPKTTLVGVATSTPPNVPLNR